MQLPRGHSKLRSQDIECIGDKIGNWRIRAERPGRGTGKLSLEESTTRETDSHREAPICSGLGAARLRGSRLHVLTDQRRPGRPQAHQASIRLRIFPHFDALG